MQMYPKRKQPMTQIGNNTSDKLFAYATHDLIALDYKQHHFAANEYALQIFTTIETDTYIPKKN